MPPLDKVYVGVDPGSNGGFAFLRGGVATCVKMPATERDVLNGLKWWGDRYQGRIYATIEQIDPRPTSYWDVKSKTWRSTILKSSCLIYGDYLRLRMALHASSIPFEAAPPNRWIRSFGLKKQKGEKPTTWKNRLKARAQELFPQTSVTLATADALLLADYCRRTRKG